MLETFMRSFPHATQYMHMQSNSHIIVYRPIKLQAALVLQICIQMNEK